MSQILFVCTANICRSPVAEALLRERLKEEGLDDWTVRSAGTWARAPHPAAEYSVQLMAERGLDIRSHRASRVDAETLQAADLVLCMEPGHVEAIKNEFPAYGHKVYLLSEMIGKRYGIHDPYGEGLPAYQAMVAELAQLIDEGWEKIVALAKADQSETTTSRQ